MAAKRRQVLLTATLTAPAFCLRAHPLRAQAPHGLATPGLLSVIIAHEAGGRPDHQVRSFLPFLQRRLPKTAFALANSAADGARMLAAAPPDERSIGVLTLAGLAARRHDTQDAPASTAFAWLGAFLQDPLVLVARPHPVPLSFGEIGTRWRSGRSGAEIAVPGRRSFAALSLLRFEHRSGLSIPTLHFPGPRLARRAASEGHVAYAFVPLSEAAASLRDERLVAVAAAAPAALNALPDTPRFVVRETTLEAVLTRAFAAPAATPPTIVAGLAEALREAAHDPDWHIEATEAGWLPHFMAGADTAALAAKTEHELGKLWAERPWTIDTAGR